ncbi:MAG: glycosyltransferase family 4 protein [Clostridia bacterium]|nr:glycosyltransferase family 4 protein [Clostridia bacterium]
MKKICMIVPNANVKGGIASVVNGYKGSKLEKDYEIIYVESYIDTSKLAKLIKAFCAYFRFAEILLFDKPDIIHIHSSFGPAFFRKLPFIYMAHFARKPIINHIHGSEFDKLYTDAGERKQKLVRKTWEKCDRFIVLSDEWKESFSVVIPEEKMDVIENYSEIKAFNPEKPLTNTVLFLGAVNEMKGCFDMPEVIRLVSKNNPEVRMIVAGSGETEKTAEIAKEKCVADRFVFPGWVRNDEKDRLLREADIFFLPSYTEGMPMSVLDAMGYGLPIVTTNVGGIPKIVKNGVNGYMLTPGDCEGFANAISEILSDSNKRKAFGKCSFEIAENAYSLEKHIEKIEKIYETF